MKIHLGCGKLYLNNYINIDILSEVADLKLDINDLKIINNNKVDEIYICHVLEHVKRQEIFDMVLEWNRIIKKDGVLRLSVPDFKKIVEIYNKNNDLSEICGLIHGGQRDIYDIHYVTYDYETIKELLENCGFYDIKIYVTFDFLKHEDDYSKATIPHMDLKNGVLMSLNIICKKEKDIFKNEIQLSNKIIKILKI